MKETRLYSLFEKTNEGKWVRISKIALKKSSAVRVFQNALLGHFFFGEPEKSLKPVKGWDDSVQARG